MASRRYERVAIGGVQLRQPLTYSGQRPAHAATSSPALSAISIALPRWAIASWKAERRSAWSPALPHHSIAGSSSAGLREMMRDEFGSAAALSANWSRNASAARRCKIWRRLLSRLS